MCKHSMIVDDHSTVGGTSSTGSLSHSVHAVNAAERWDCLEEVLAEHIQVLYCISERVPAMLYELLKVIEILLQYYMTQRGLSREEAASKIKEILGRARCHGDGS